MNNEEISRKLKNKKKDIISINDTEPIKQKEPPSNKTEQNKKPQIEPQYSLELNHNTSFLMNKILFEIQLLFSMTDKIDDKLNKAISPLLSQENLKNILLERECRSICGYPRCNNQITNKTTGKASFNKLLNLFSTKDIEDYFCSDECIQCFKTQSLLSDKFDYVNLISLDNILMFSTIQDYYPPNKYLTRIASLAQNLLDEFERHNKQLKLDDYFKYHRLKIAQKFIDDFDAILASDEFKHNPELQDYFFSKVN